MLLITYCRQLGSIFIKICSCKVSLCSVNQHLQLGLASVTCNYNVRNFGTSQKFKFYEYCHWRDRLCISKKSEHHQCLYYEQKTVLMTTKQAEHLQTGNQKQHNEHKNINQVVSSLIDREHQMIVMHKHKNCGWLYLVEVHGGIFVDVNIRRDTLLTDTEVRSLWMNCHTSDSIPLLTLQSQSHQPTTF